MWPISSTGPDFQQAHPTAGPFLAACTATDTARAACRASINSGVCGFKCGGYCYGIAGRSMLDQVTALVERLYACRGYRTASIKQHAESPHRIAFGGSHRGRLFATLTLGLDCPDGLLVDELYRSEVDIFRRTKRRICELSAFAIDPRYSSHGVLASLFYLAYWYGRTLHQVTDAFIEVNPRHAGFYERVFHFHRIGAIRNCPRVDAPAILLHLDLEHFEAHCAPSGETEAKPAAPTGMRARARDARRASALAHH